MDFRRKKIILTIISYISNLYKQIMAHYFFFFSHIMLKLKFAIKAFWIYEMKI
jgi:hypothetical protein